MDTGIDTSAAGVGLGAGDVLAAAAGVRPGTAAGVGSAGVVEAGELLPLVVDSFSSFTLPSLAWRSRIFAILSFVRRLPRVVW